MCDEFTLETGQAPGATQTTDSASVTRRDFAAMGMAAMAAVAMADAADAATATRGLVERIVSVPTPDGHADAFFVYPAQGKHPGVVMWPDIAGVRDAFKVMARRLARAGYAVLVVNQYYRTNRAPVMNTIAEYFTPEGMAKLKPMIAALSPAGTSRDGAAFVAFLDKQSVVDAKRKIGTQGYCMGGPNTIRTAAAAPGRVGAAASFHGGGLVTPKPDSPHLLVAASKASYLFAIARNDDARAPTDKDVLRSTATAAGRPAEIEVYPADHGWCALDAPMYDAVQADNAWGRLLALYAKL